MMEAPRFHLVMTVALRAELPRDGCGVVPVFSVKDQGPLAVDPSIRVCVVVTGVGLDASRKAALWIAETFRPLYVMNIGLCGTTQREDDLNTWFQPTIVQNEKGDLFCLPDVLPISFPLKCSKVSALTSCEKPVSQNPLIPTHLVDMEAFAQASVLQPRGISFHCLKSVSDRLDPSRPTFRQAIPRFHDDLEQLFQTFFSPKPKITVVIPTFNRAGWMSACVESVLSQKTQPYEVIVVNDGSTDHTKKKLEPYKNQVKVITLDENRGVSHARNVGIAHAKGDWIATLDSDDQWKPRKLESQLAFLSAAPFYKILQSEEIWVRNGKHLNPKKIHQKPEGWAWAPCLERCLISPSSVLFQKSMCSELGGFDETLPVCEDYDFWIRVTRKWPIGFDRTKMVVKFGGHSDQLSSSYEVMDHYRIKSLKKALAEEANPIYQEKIAAVLQKKCQIVENGRRKRSIELLLRI